MKPSMNQKTKQELDVWMRPTISPSGLNSLSEERGGERELKRIVTLLLTIILGPIWYYNALSIEVIYGP